MLVKIRLVEIMKLKLEARVALVVLVELVEVNLKQVRRKININLVDVVKLGAIVVG